MRPVATTVMSVPLAQRDALAKFELVIVIIVDAFHSQTAEADIARALVLNSSANRGLHFVMIAGVQNDHARDGAHERDVPAALMCSAVFTDGDAGVGADDLDIQLRITNGVADLLKRSACGEHGKGCRKRNFTAGGQTGSNADHVALCDAAVKETFRYAFLKMPVLVAAARSASRTTISGYSAAKRGNGLAKAFFLLPF